MSLRLLFVCTGNTCRSPMAEALARAEARARGLDAVEVRSAGTFALVGSVASPLAAVVAADRGLDLSGHAASPLDPERVAWADLVLGMTPGHVEAARHAGAGGRAVLLTSFLPEEHPRRDAPVPDPAGGDRDAYEAAFALLESAVVRLFDHHLPAAPGAKEERPEGDG